MDVGLYGKLPTHGDFLRRRVADDFVAGWDAWLQQCLAESRASLGEQWLETYLTSPVWRFVLPASVCGAAGVAGLLVPSVDRVGRYFPLTILWVTPAGLSTLETALRFRVGFEQAERLVLDTLAAEQFEFADFDRSVMELAALLENPSPEEAVRLEAASLSAVTLPISRSFCIPLADATALAAPSVQLFGRLLDAGGATALWWTEGSARVEPSWLVTRGLPDATQYSAMLDGAWAEAGWQWLATEKNLGATSATPPAPIDVAPAGTSLPLLSAALSDRGSVRAINQDAFLERPDRGLWVVADGLGGLAEGEVASRMVCDSLADARFVVSLDEQVEIVSGQLQEVNAHLRRNANRAVNPVRSGSTVLALLIRQKECAVIWAGDSRAYRLRDGLLSQMTTDHSWNQLDALQHDDPGADQAITKAVGGEDEFIPETLRSDVRAGDRYMLCSDGVYRALDLAQLTQHLAHPDALTCCKELVARAMNHGSTDNVTAVVVDCGAATAPPSTPPAATGLIEMLAIESVVTPPP